MLDIFDLYGFQLTEGWWKDQIKYWRYETDQYDFSSNMKEWKYAIQTS